MNENTPTNIYMIPMEALQPMMSAQEPLQFRRFPDVLTVQQTAALMGLCKNTVYKLIRENRLPCRRIGTAIRIRKKDVMSYLRSAS